MDNWVHPVLVMEFRRMASRDEAEQTRPKEERLPALRREAIGLKDKVTWLSCQLQSRLSPGMDAAAC
jgi:hypothetical protein